MRIIDIEVLELRVPSFDAQTFDGSYDDCVVLVHTDAGITGLAEVDSVPGVIRAIVEARDSHTGARGLKSVLLGEDPNDPERLWQRMYDATHYYGRRGVVIHAMSAIDIALWDIKGKLEEKPVGQLLGQPQRESLLAYGTVYPLGRTPDEARHAIDRGLALGLKAIKLVADPWWGEDRDGAATVIRAAREHVGRDIRLILDAATAWTEPQDGLWLMPLLKECGFAFIEAPLPLDNVAGHAQFQGWNIPVGSGDLGLTTHAEYIPFFEVGRIDIAQPDVTMVGGFTELVRLAALARRYGRRVVTHGYKSNITIACNLHFLSQHCEDEMLEYSTSESPLRWRLTRERFPIEADGRVAVPTAPGLGVSLDPDAVAEFRIS